MWLTRWGLGFGSWIAVVSVLVRRIDILVRVVDFILDGDGDGDGVGGLLYSTFAFAFAVAVAVAWFRECRFAVAVDSGCGITGGEVDVYIGDG